MDRSRITGDAGYTGKDPFIVDKSLFSQAIARIIAGLGRMRLLPLIFPLPLRLHG